LVLRGGRGGASGGGGDVAGGAAGGAVVAILRPDGTVTALIPPRRRYRGYPSDTATIFQNGDEPIIVGPPDGWGWNVLAMLWQIEYDAGEAGGQPIVNIRRRDDTVIVPVRHPPRVAGEIIFTYYTQGASYPEFAVAGVYGTVYPLPMNGELKDEYLEFDPDGAPADQHRVFVYFEEFEL